MANGVQAQRKDNVRADGGGRVRRPAEVRTFWVASLVAFALTFVVGWLKWRAGQSGTTGTR